MKSLILLICLVPSLAWAKDKPQRDYKDGVLVSYGTVSIGSSCSSYSATSGNVNATTNSSGNTTGNVAATTNGSTDCSPDRAWQYVIKVGDNRFSIEPIHHNPFGKNSVLANQLPGTHILVSSDDKGFWVKLGKRESKYVIVEAK